MIDMPKLKRTNKPKKADPKGKRRYSAGRYSIYDRTYDLKKKRSPILNSEARSNDIRYAGALMEEGACKKTLLELDGNPDKHNHYLDESGEWQMALIPGAKNNLRKIHREFKQWQRKQVQEGFAIEKPTEWPKDLLEKRLKAEAIVDIYRREKAKVKQILKEHKRKAEKERQKKILEFGPQGKGLRHDPNSSRPWLIDGQRISRNGYGVPYIDEPSSPYHEMPIAIYRKISAKWRDHQMKKAKESMAKREKECKEKGELVPGSIISWRNLKLPKDDFPDWPEGAKKISDIGK